MPQPFLSAPVSPQETEKSTDGGGGELALLAIAGAAPTAMITGTDQPTPLTKVRRFTADAAATGARSWFIAALFRGGKGVDRPAPRPACMINSEAPTSDAIKGA